MRFEGLVSKNRDIFKISVQLASKDRGFSATDIEAALINKEFLLPFLQDLPNKGGGNTIKMQELGALRESQPPELRKRANTVDIALSCYLQNHRLNRQTWNKSLVMRLPYSLLAELSAKIGVPVKPNIGLSPRLNVFTQTVRYYE